MYTMVLMMAVSSGGDVASFGHHRGGCTGCTGTVVVAAPTSCTGMVAPTGCTCHGAKKGFLGLGLHDKLFSHHSSCHGTVVAAPAPCCPPVVAMPVAPVVVPPKVMPKTEDPKPKTEDPKPKPKTESN